MSPRAGNKFQTCLISLGCWQLLHSSSPEQLVSSPVASVNISHITIQHTPRQSNFAWDEAGGLGGCCLGAHQRSLRGPPDHYVCRCKLGFTVMAKTLCFFRISFIGQTREHKEGNLTFFCFVLFCF